MKRKGIIWETDEDSVYFSTKGYQALDPCVIRYQAKPSSSVSIKERGFWIYKDSCMDIYMYYKYKQNL